MKTYEHMITIICATHRPKNQTQTVVDAYQKLLEERGLENSVFSMEDLPAEFFEAKPFSGVGEKTERLIAEKISPADKLVVISPEYNGSFPGIFKAFLDSLPPKLWWGKKAALVGVASGRAGNIRGMDHLTDVFHHLKIEVYSQKVPISKIDGLLNENKELAHSDTLAVLTNQLNGFLKF